MSYIDAMPLDCDPIARFLCERTGGWMPVERAKDVVSNIVSGPDAVRELWQDGARTAIGIIVDTCETTGNAAELSLFCAVADPALLDQLLDWARERLRGSPRQNLDIPRWPGLFVPEDWLAGRGFSRAHTLHEMAREGLELPSPPAPLPRGWQWCDYTDAHFDGFYEVLSQAFRDVPGAFVLERGMARARARRLAIPPQLLCREGEVAAFVRLDVSGTSGDIAMLGRHPRHRGAGLGPHLIQRGLVVLVAHGARRQLLEVAAENDRAMALYERAGFARVRSYDVWRRPLSLR